MNVQQQIERVDSFMKIIKNGVLILEGYGKGGKINAASLQVFSEDESVLLDHIKRGHIRLYMYFALVQKEEGPEVIRIKKTMSNEEFDLIFNKVSEDLMAAISADSEEDHPEMFSKRLYKHLNLI